MTVSNVRRLDVVLPTYNRPDLLGRALDSLAHATVPAGLQVQVIVVDNNSLPEHAAVNRQLVDRMDKSMFRLITERQQGLSFSRNAGIAASSADWIGFIDDDEQIEPNWYEIAAQFLSRDDIDFISGACLPDWEAPPPAWLPALVGKYIAVIGWVELSETVKEFGREIDAIAMGGNAVFKRACLDKVGFYATNLGRVRGRLLSGEDQDMHERLVACGCRGFYVPELAIRHFVPLKRMTKPYHRKWAFWHGYSTELLEQGRKRTVPHLFGVPRYSIRRLLSSLPVLLTSALKGQIHSPRTYSQYLDAIELLGRFYAKLDNGTSVS